MCYHGGVMAELGCEMLVTHKAYPLVKDKIEERLRFALEAAGATDIVVYERDHIYIKPFLDEESGETLGGYWAWSIRAEGVKA
ncbi:hypothetical protein LCGC14_1258400 [marine sediment metagenome]|uniref:Uncharacterized protein n=1 Tax=marine sediment metagenome TaxID=412755 RepID=A0A0F9NI32_9ZZZZ